MTEQLTRWIEQHAHPLIETDPGASLADLRPLRGMVDDAKVVALGTSIRWSHELSTLSLRILRILTEELGFRSLAMEGDDATHLGLSEYIRTGTGDPRAMLTKARSFWQTGEMLDVVEWMRAHNRRHPDDPVRFAENREQIPQSVAQPGDLASIERNQADNTLWWHDHTSEKIVYWGGMAHTANGNPRTVSPSAATQRNAGSYLRERLGSDYVSIGLTFDHGFVSYPVLPPPPDFAEATLATTNMDAYLLDLRERCPAPMASWLNAPTRTRLIGPTYDPEDNASYHMSGGSLKDWFDIIVHYRVITPVDFLS